MRRLSRLALPWAARVQAVAAAGIPAKLYGAAVSRPMAAALCTAKTAALRVLAARGSARRPRRSAAYWRCLGGLTPPHVSPTACGTRPSG